MSSGFGEFYGQTSLHPLALATTIALVLALFAVRRQLAFAPLMVAATTLPLSQRIVVAGADFTLMRILLLAYVLRIMVRKEGSEFRWNRIDTVVVLWALSGTLIMTIQLGTAGAFINRVGWTFEILATYFAIRCLVRTTDDVLALAKIIAITSIPIAALFAVETVTHKNLFSIFGGVSPETTMREGRFRCQGAFAHPIVAGTFWASTLPLIWMLWKQEGFAHRLCLLGTAATFVIIFACSSSTPLLSAAVAMAGLALFRYRAHRRRMWIGLIIVLLVLHLIMDRPVWHLLARVDLVGGSTGWHRFVIFDAFVTHFSEWFLLGDTNPSTHWGVWQMRDITNQYILEGLRGGFIALFFFVLVLLYSFGDVGRALKAIAGRNNILAEKVVWLIGVTILVHTVSFFGVSYFGQMTAMLYIHFGLAGAVVPQLLPHLLGTGAGSPPPGRMRRVRRAAG